MKRSPIPRVSGVAAAILGAAPLVTGLLLALRTEDDRLILWMATGATFFTAGVLAAAIGRRRSRHAVIVQSTVIFVVSTLLAGVTAFLRGAGSGPGVWGVACAIGGCLAASSVLIAVARASASAGDGNGR